MVSWTLQCQKPSEAWNDTSIDEPGSISGCTGTCDRGEVCVQGPDDRAWHTSIAFCVDEHDLHHYINGVDNPSSLDDNDNHLDGNTQTSAQTLNITPPPSIFRGVNEQGYVEAVLTGQNHDGALFYASSIVLRPTDKDNKVLSHGARCENCARLNYGPWPADTTKIAATVTLPHVHDIAFMTYVFFKP